MEAMLVLLGLVVLAIPIAVIYLLVSLSGAKTRITQLEQDVGRLRGRGEDAQSFRKSYDQSPWEKAAGPAHSDPGPQARDTSPPTEAAEEFPTDVAQPDIPDKDFPDTDAEDDNLPAAARVIAERRAALKQRDAIAAQSQTPARSGPSSLQRLITWLAANWFYAVSAVSLALAGLFLVQYGIETGYLTPTARVLAALGFGASLIAAGEYIRRRFGDDSDSTTAYLPSVFSGAGLVSLFGGVTAARLLYDLIGVETAFAGLACVGLLGVVLGWLHGPLLAAIGVTGAFGAPLLVGSDVPATAWLFVYFSVVAAVGLGIDTIRRWAWISLLTVVLAFGMGWLTHVGGTGLAPGLLIYLFSLAVLTVLIPARSFWPDHTGTMVSDLIINVRKEQPGFPTLLAAAVVIAASVSCVVVLSAEPDTFWLSLGVLTVLALALIVWSVNAPALQDLALVPAAALVGVISNEATMFGSTYRSFLATYAEVAEGTEPDFPLDVTVLWGIGMVLSLVAAQRATRPGMDLLWGLLAALAAPVVAVVVEVTWQPAEVIGAYLWALHSIVMAALMVSLALRFARRDGEDKTRVSVFVLSAMASITFAMVLIVSLAALTVALAATVVVTAALDRRFDLPLMQIFIAVGVTAVGFRLVADPGLYWATDAPLGDMVLAYGGAFIAFCASLWLLRGKTRLVAQVMLDTAAWSTGGMLASLLLERALSRWAPDGGVGSHWSMGLYATIWLIMMLVQIVRAEKLSGLRQFRVALAVVFGGIGVAALGASLTELSPLFTGWVPTVSGPPVINTLAVAYLLPASVLSVGAMNVRNAKLRAAFWTLVAGLAAYWAFAALRHFWQPDTMNLQHGFLQGELYSYTVAILAVGAALFYQSLARGSRPLRRAGLLVIGLAVAKVFLIDITGLTGLTRVFSLVLLGLALAALAWLNRWAQDRAQPK